MNPEEVKFLVVHCSRSLPLPTDGFRYMDRRCRLRGALSCGYHWVIRTDGIVEEGRALTHPGCHCRGVNDKSVGICVMGGVTEDGKAGDTRTPEQRRALSCLLGRLREMFPAAKAVTHEQLRPVDGRDCPGFSLD